MFEPGLMKGQRILVTGGGTGLGRSMAGRLLSLGADSRMNTPATIGGKNWRWRVRAEALNPTVSSMLGEITKTYMRG